MILGCWNSFAEFCQDFFPEKIVMEGFGVFPCTVSLSDIHFATKLSPKIIKSVAVSIAAVMIYSFSVAFCRALDFQQSHHHRLTHCLILTLWATDSIQDALNKDLIYHYHDNGLLNAAAVFSESCYSPLGMLTIIAIISFPTSFISNCHFPEAGTVLFPSASVHPF